MIEFKDIQIKMREIRQAEQSDYAACELMARFAYNADGEKLTLDQFMLLTDDITPVEFGMLWLRFKLACATPKGS